MHRVNRTYRCSFHANWPISIFDMHMQFFLFCIFWLHWGLWSPHLTMLYSLRGSLWDAGTTSIGFSYWLLLYSTQRPISHRHNGAHVAEWTLANVTPCHVGHLKMPFHGPSLPLHSLRYKGIVLMRSQMKCHFEVPDLEVRSHASRDFCSPAKHQ